MPQQVQELCRLYFHASNQLGSTGEGGAKLILALAGEMGQHLPTNENHLVTEETRWAIIISLQRAAKANAGNNTWDREWYQSLTWPVIIHPTLNRAVLWLLGIWLAEQSRCFPRQTRKVLCIPVRRHVQMPTDNKILIGDKLDYAISTSRVIKSINGTMDRRSTVRRKREFLAEDHFSVCLDGPGEALVAFRFGGMWVGEKHVEDDGARSFGGEPLDEPGVQRSIPGGIIWLIQIAMRFFVHPYHHYFCGLYDRPFEERNVIAR